MCNRETFFRFLFCKPYCRFFLLSSHPFFYIFLFFDGRGFFFFFFIFFFIFFFVGNLVVNRFILLFATACYPFFGKSFTIHVRTGIKYWLFNLLLVFVIILLSFLSVDALLRLVSGPLLPNDLSSAKIKHPSTGWG